MRNQPIGIMGYGALSAAGSTPAAAWRHHQNSEPAFQRHVSGDWVAPLDAAGQQFLADLVGRHAEWPPLDRTAWLAIAAAQQATGQAGWPPGTPLGVQMGSSRGATGRWEEFHEQFQRHPESALSPLVSPLTTLGNIASWTALALGGGNPTISHSITCSTALHAVLNAAVWLESGRSDRFLAGGAEAALTSFSIAQLKALRLYASSAEAEYPCRALDLGKRRNSLVLGEGAAAFCLEKSPTQPPLAWIAGLGYGVEWAGNPTGITPQAEGLQAAMRMAMAEAGLTQVDAILTHAPGTLRGDVAEVAAIEAVFGFPGPVKINNKWKIGHTLGASAGLSLVLALQILAAQELPAPPAYLAPPLRPPRLENIMVNGMGFGGNAISLIVQRP